MSDTPKRDETVDDEKPANSAPDAVMDPNEKTEGHPGMGPQGGKKDREADPGGG